MWGYPRIEKSFWLVVSEILKDKQKKILIDSYKLELYRKLADPESTFY